MTASHRSGARGDLAPFDISGPLPTGVTLLEASAGTGKTFTIAALVARFVAEGTALDRLLVVTFTRMATGELRERVRERLVTAAEGLSDALAGVPADPSDDVLRALADGPCDEVERRHDRLAKAIADFDAATIETTHGFCLHVLVGLGVAGDVEPDVTFVEDARDLLDEVVDDLYIRRFWIGDEPPPFDRKQAVRIGRAVLANASAEVLPPLSDDRTTWAIRRRLARAIGEEIERRKRAVKVITYDDLLTRLDRTLADDERGPAVCQWLRSRYDVALVDEFQDTDLVQWDIIRRVFGSGGSTLVLIGDPKQAIYAFRGADVYSYLGAAKEAATKATLVINWRSDQGLIDAYDTLFAGSQLGHEGIAYRKVKAAAPNVDPRLIGAPGAPLRVRVVHRDDVGLTPQGYASLNPARAFVARDLAADVVTLLTSDAEIVQPGGRGQPVRPGHLAVLVFSNDQALRVCDALHDAGVPAVTSGSGSVFATEPASQWLQLLDALERPTSRDRAGAAALTAFIGWSADEVANATEPEWEDLHWLLHRLASLLRRRGVAALLEHMSATEHLPQRILGRTSGERFWTDLRHVGQLLHAEVKADDLGSTALTTWLRRRIDEAASDRNDEDRSRRLESDAEAVQVLTIHRSKGLEFPIVYCPYLWDVYSPKEEIPTFHDPGNDDMRTIDVGGPDAPAIAGHGVLDLREKRGEDVRLLYVALTRARHQAVVWWAGTFQGRDSPLPRLLFDRDDSGVVAPQGSNPPTDADAIARFEELARESNGQVSVERATGGAGAVWHSPDRHLPALETCVFERTLDECWRRTSYSGITSGTHDARVGSEPEEEVITDEGVPGATFAAGEGDVAEEALRDVALLLADMPGGAEVGTFIHRVLETADFAAGELAAELRGRIEAELRWRHLDLGDLDAVVAGLQATVATPLGPLVDGVRLCDIGLDDRLDEMSFELPLAGGDAPSGDLSVSDIATELRTHLAADDALAGYADRLADPSLDRTLRGYLSGSLDLVVRLPGQRFAIVDYKTNRLGAASGTAALDAWHYRPAALRAEMYHAHYPLQALLYTVALHRYLRWRIASYDPSKNFAGVLYLFVRGMSSPDFPRTGDQPCGVWSWRPPTALIEALSDLFDRGSNR